MIEMNEGLLYGAFRGIFQCEMREPREARENSSGPLRSAFSSEAQARRELGIEDKAIIGTVPILLSRIVVTLFGEHILGGGARFLGIAFGRGSARRLGAELQVAGVDDDGEGIWRWAQ